MYQLLVSDTDLPSPDPKVENRDQRPYMTHSVTMNRPRKNEINIWPSLDRLQICITSCICVNVIRKTHSKFFKIYEGIRNRIIKRGFRNIPSIFSLHIQVTHLFFRHGFAPFIRTGSNITILQQLGPKLELVQATRWDDTKREVVFRDWLCPSGWLVFEVQRKNCMLKLLPTLHGLGPLFP